MGDLKNEFTWSKSRDSLFQECRRAYYLNHYGAWGGWNASAPPEVRELYLMKNLNSRATWLGIVVHEVAERALRALRGEIDWPLEAALAEAEQRLRAELEISRQGQYRTGARVRWNGRWVKVSGLQEHFYGLPTPDEEWEAAIAQALQCVTNLYHSPTFRRLQEVGPGAILSVEELESFLVGDVKVWVKLDLAVRRPDGGIVIVDWKTGSAHREEDIALQLGIYGLYGTRLWGVPPDRIRGFDVNLRDGATHQHPIDGDRLSEVSDYIQTSAQQMRALLDDVAENRASAEKFPLTEDLSLCRRCRFRRACGRE
jgi:PAS domain-containing protein